MTDFDQAIPPPITQQRVVALLADNHPRRICFRTTHAHEPKRSQPPYAGTLNVPFCETIGRIFESDLGLRLFQNPNRPGYWRSIQTEEEYARIETWVKQQGTRVFLRDCLDMSLALGINLEKGPDGQPAGHTPLGALEARAKAGPDEEAISQLQAAFIATIRAVPGYREARLIAAVPPRPGKAHDLPSLLAGRIAAALGIEDLTPRFRFAAPKGTVKAARLEEKWAAWEQSGLGFDPPLSERLAVILIDDKYQSGISIQFVASVLRAAGAGEIYGLCAVKTWRDTDNA
ncbi:hypothetical protein GCM10010964_42410 [Caldovatus sediminis]|uniref:Phosphoribosyltransferase n=1 Tax=Caldovatus sediminis TaxID=2041189 RepID=A0A8J2ZEU9_9PROT|nr:hypothetical protein [Caldovatus sediminis]GGG50683.1 hypothetical protein GCM10010964_42410 [Caldovatus sediminis]